MRTLVITPCSARKKSEVPDLARSTDLADPIRRREAEERLADLACPAIDMYTSTHHQLVAAGVRAAWERWGRHVMELYILSGGYGLLQADTPIIPYDVSLEEFEGTDFWAWVDHLRIPEEAPKLVRSYDLVFYLLSGRYLAVLDLPLDVPESVQQIVLTDHESLDLIPRRPNLHTFVASGNVAAQRWHVKATHVRGFLFGRLCNQIVHHGPGVLEWLYHRPQDTERLFYKRARWRPQFPLWEANARQVPGR
jgi:hypothetical protein